MNLTGDLVSKKLFFGFVLLSIGMSQAEASDIFFRTSSTSFEAPQTLEECRTRIKMIVCLVEPSQNIDDSRPCLPESKQYASHFEHHFDQSPKLIQKMYCHLDHIWIEKNFYATAYASPVFNSQRKIAAGAIGIRKEVLDGNLSFDEWLSWKEETSFGGNTQATNQRLNLLQYKTNQSTKDFFIAYVLNHEFGHLFDFANNLNQIRECRWVEVSPGKWKTDGDCRQVPQTWGALSWIDIETPKVDFPLRKSLCFYGCRGRNITPDQVETVFAGLVGSSFASTYASTNPTEDWAETFALFLAETQSGLKMKLETKKITFDLSEHFASPLMTDKRQFVQNFVSSKVKYPGD